MRSSSTSRDDRALRRRCRPGACRRQQAPVGGRPMTDDQLILLAVLPIFRAPTEGDRGSQLEDGSAWVGSMELTRRCLLHWGIMLGGGAALIPTRRWFVVLRPPFALASLAHAAPGDPRLVQGVLEWPTTLTAEPFVVIRTEDGRWYYADIKSARRLEPAALTVGARVAVLGTEAARPHEITALAFGSGDAAALALAGGGTSFVIKDPATGQFFRFRANSPTVSNLALPMRSRSVWGRAFVVGGFSSE